VQPHPIDIAALRPQRPHHFRRRCLSSSKLVADGQRRPLMVLRHPQRQPPRHRPRAWRERGGTTRQAWLTIEVHFLGNCETRTLHLEDTFQVFVQGDLKVNDYYPKTRSMADALRNLDESVADRTVVLNILRGLNKKYDHLKTFLKLKPFSSFHNVRNDLRLEELMLGIEAAFGRQYQQPPPSPAAFGGPHPSLPPSSDHRRRNNRHSETSTSSDSMITYGSTTTPITGQRSAPWLSFYNP
jgi:hypothetical protein